MATSSTSWLTPDWVISVVTIRQFRPDDTDAVHQLFREGQQDFMADQFPTEASRKALDGYIQGALSGDLADVASAYLERPNSNFWIAEKGDRPIGCLGIYRLSDAEAEVRRVAVDRDSRRLGVASRLMDHAESFCRDAGYSRIVLRTASFLTAAISMYQRRGYQLIAEEGFPNTTIIIYWYALEL